MATYYPNSTNHKDLIPAMYQRILGHESFPDSSFPANMTHLNCPSSHVELPMADVASSHVGDNFINAFREGKSMMIHPDYQMDGQNMPLMASNLHGLSLSLGRHHLIQSFHHHASSSDMPYFGSHQLPTRSSLHSRERNISYEPDPQPPVLNSKYLKAAQELLDEVVNVRKALKQKREKVQHSEARRESDVNLKSEKMHHCAHSDPSLDERLGLQNKMTKLLNMLDEVDRRYKQYHDQMQEVVSSFDRIAGPGTAIAYTRLALETISRHFRSLRDAIDGQIRFMSMYHGDLEDPCHGDHGNGTIQRLRFIDHKLHRDRSFHQHTWRLQRGLPESSVSILRAWLFEHFLHPYPKDADKLLLAKQTGLTRNQVSNWFINARVRLWKPMVEEMYREELGGNKNVDSTSDCDKSPLLNSPSEATPPPPPQPENPTAAIRPAVIRADGSGGSVVSLTLGLHHNDRHWSAAKAPATAEMARINGGIGIESAVDFRDFVV